MLDFTNYDPEKIEQSRQAILPELRVFAAECRKERPLLAFDALSAAQLEQHRILREKMEAARARFRFSESCVALIHTSPVGLLASRDAFRGVEEGVICLLREERAEWFRRTAGSICGCHRILWWNLYDRLSKYFVARVARRFSRPDGETYWALNHGDDEGSSFRDIWTWDGQTAHPIGHFDGICCEHGLPPDYFE
jgi:hypothetical protein